MTCRHTSSCGGVIEKSKCGIAPTQKTANTANASSVSYEVTITLNDDDTWSYSELTTLHMKEFGDPFPHTDSNTLIRIK